MLKEENICNLDFEIGEYCMKAKNSMRHFKTFFDRLLRYSIFLSQNRLNAAPLLWLFSSETSWGPLNFFPFLSFTARSKKKSKRFICNHSCLKLFGSSALLWDRNFTSHYIVWLADCEMMKCAPANSNQGRFSISTNQTFAICRKNSHALNSLPLKWIYKCMSEYVKECKVGDAKNDRAA